MASTNMAALFAGAEDAGFSGKDLSHGDYDVRVKRSSVKSGATERLLITFEAISGAGTCLEGQSFNPENKGSMFHWFRFLANFGIGRDFIMANPDITVEQIGMQIVSASDQGQTFRIRFQQQESNQQYDEVVILGDATGEPDAPKSAGRVAPPTPAVAEAVIPSPAPVEASLPQPWDNA